MGILPMSGFPNAIYRVWGPSRRDILALPSRGWQRQAQSSELADGLHVCLLTILTIVAWASSPWIIGRMPIPQDSTGKMPVILMGGTPMLLSAQRRSFTS